MVTSSTNAVSKSRTNTWDRVINYSAPIYTFIREHAQEMEQEVLDRHIGLYVNDYSLSLGEVGRATIEKLSQLAGDL